MGLTIADIDRWDAGAISAVSQASANRASSAAQAGGSLGGLPVFNTWAGRASAAAAQQTATHAAGLDSHGQDATAVANATRTAANEVNQIKSQLSALRSSAGSWGITIDPASSRAVAPVTFDSLPDETKQTVRTMVRTTQAGLDKLREAADKVDDLLAGGLKESKHKVTIKGPEGKWRNPDYLKESKRKEFGDEDLSKKKAPKSRVQAEIAKKDTGKHGAVVDKQVVKGVTMDAFTAQVGANAKVGSNGLSAGANANATLVGAEAKGSKDWGIGHGEASVRAAAEANASVNATVGKEGVNVHGEAFAGARVTGDVHADVGGVGAGAHGELQAGIGASADINAGFKDGKLKIGGSIGACLGVGGKASFNVEIDPGKVTNTIGNGVKNVGKFFGLG